MSIPASPDKVPNPSLVDSALIASLEGSHPSSTELYEKLKTNAPQIALWFRRRAVELNPDLTQRDHESQLALEVASLCLSRTTEGPEITAELEQIEQIFADNAHPTSAV